MEKLHKLPMTFSAAFFECPVKKRNQQRVLKKKLMISLICNIFAIGFFLGVCGSTINWAVDRVDLNISSDMERPISRPGNGKPLMKPHILDESFWSRECNFNLAYKKLARIPLKSLSKSAPLNDNCTSFAHEKLTKLTNNQNE